MKSYSPAKFNHLLLTLEKKTERTETELGWAGLVAYFAENTLPQQRSGDAREAPPLIPRGLRGQAGPAGRRH